MRSADGSIVGELAGLGKRIQEEVEALVELVESTSIAKDKMPGGGKAVPQSEIGGLRTLQREADALFGFLHMSGQEVTKRAAEFKESLAGPIQVLEEPDRADDEWEKAHGEYLRLMQDYIGSFAEVHRRHKIMMDFYERELEPRRGLLLRRAGIHPAGGHPASA
jgi:hypothetical protein